VTHLDDGENAVLMTGQVEVVTDRAEREMIAPSYGEKYKDALTGTLASALDPDDLLYRLRVQSITAWVHSNAATRTDWQFEG
jgi:hypothetical protein